MNGGAQRIVVDTGPLVAFMNRADQYQDWAREEFERLTPPLFTCEAVLSEAQLLLQERGGNPLAVLVMLERGILKVDFEMSSEVERLLELQRAFSRPDHGLRLSRISPQPATDYSPHSALRHLKRAPNTFLSYLLTMVTLGRPFFLFSTFRIVSPPSGKPWAN
jgi:hypothetical protein